MKKLTNAAAEQLLLGSCIKYPDTLDAVIEKIGSADFADHRAGTIFASLCRVTLAGKSGAVALVEDLRESGELDAVGGDRAITYLESKSRRNGDTVQEAVGTILELAKRREQAAAAQQIAQTIQNGGDAASEIAKLSAGNDGSREGWADLGSVLTSIMAGTHRRLEPTLLERNDGAFLFYGAGRLNWIAAPPESFKSWVAKLTCLQVLEKGGTAIYIDFEESDPTSCTERMISIALGRGHSIEQIREWLEGKPGEPNTRTFFYRSATAGFDAAARAQTLRVIKSRSAQFVVLDGVAAAMGSHNPPLEEDKARDVNMWLAANVWGFANAGAGILCVDHTVKNNTGAPSGSYSARSPRGSGAKLAAVSGTAVIAEVRTPGSAWTRGEVDLWVAKDRPGRVKVTTRNGRRLAATLISTPQPNQLVECTKIEILSPETAAEIAAERRWDLIAAEHITSMLANENKPMSKGDIKDTLNERRKATGGKGWKNDTVAAAFSFLIDNGYVAAERDGRFETLILVKRYRADMGAIHADEKQKTGDPF